MVRASASHSWVMTLVLSMLVGRNPSTTLRVGTPWAKPHTATSGGQVGERSTHTVSLRFPVCDQQRPWSFRAHAAGVPPLKNQRGRTGVGGI